MDTDMKGEKGKVDGVMVTFTEPEQDHVKDGNLHTEMEFPAYFAMKDKPMYLKVLSPTEYIQVVAGGQVLSISWSDKLSPDGFLSIISNCEVCSSNTYNMYRLTVQTKTTK